MLLVVGDLVEDVVVWPVAPPRRGTDTEARIERRRGGSAANVASFAAAVGCRVRFVGCVGTDAVGGALADGLGAAGVDVRVQRRGRTGTIVVLVEPDGERTMLPDRGACTLLGPVPDDWLDGVSWLHVPAYSRMGEPLASSVASVIGRVRRAGGRVSIDASSVGALVAHGLEAFTAWLAEVRPDVLLANAEEAVLLGLVEPSRRTATSTVVKRGPEPVLLWTGGVAEPVAVPVPAVAGVRDTTGAGDAFAAGFLAALAAGRPPVEAVEAGSALARRVLGNPGASL
jgi:sugar/nucleoside kinase (ribokinase family)